MSDKAKNKTTIWITPEASDLVDSFYTLDNCRTKSVYIEKAIRFYSGYVAENKISDYLSTVVSSSVTKTISGFENRMAKMLFKFAVEHGMMMNLFAAYNDVDKHQLERLRGQCVEEVKRTKGAFSFDDAYKWQKGVKDEPSDS